MFLVKGQRLLAALFAFIECIIWALIVSGIITDLNSNIFWLAAYCMGYACGFYVGSFIEGKIAIGTMDVQVVVPLEKENEVRECLRENNIGFYISDIEGATGKKAKKITIIVKRKKAKEIRKKITEICNGDVFVLNFDVAYLRGGYGVKNEK